MNLLKVVVRIIARSNLVEFWGRHPEAKSALASWERRVKEADWKAMSDVQDGISKAKVLNGDRVRFTIGGGDFRLIAAFDFARQIVFIKFIGTHAEYDRVDALRIAQF